MGDGRKPEGGAGDASWTDMEEVRSDLVESVPIRHAMVLAGRLSSPVVRPPTHQPDEATRRKIADVLRNAGMLQKQAA